MRPGLVSDALLRAFLFCGLALQEGPARRFQTATGGRTWQAWIWELIRAKGRVPQDAIDYESGVDMMAAAACASNHQVVIWVDAMFCHFGSRLSTNALEFWPCGYSAQCRVKNCKARATTLARSVDNGGRPLKQYELCTPHVEQVAERECGK